MSKRREVKITPQEYASSAGYVVGFIAFVAAYFLAEAVLKTHVSHWIAAFGAAALAGGSAYVLTLWRQNRRAHR